jgi:FHA domain
MAFTCRRGHQSLSDDYCDVCGAKNLNAAQRTPSWWRPPAEPPCPMCGTAREENDRYCAGCAYDFETGQVLPPRPVAQAAQASAGPYGTRAAVATGLVLVLTFDAQRANEPGCPPPPMDASEHVFIVDQPSIIIGRDDANGVHVPIPADPYVSRRHAEIIDLGGAWGIRDLGSTNGTKLNGLAMVGAEVKLIKANDIVEIGCFSRITVRDRSFED